MKSIGILLIACLCSLTSFSQECPDSCVVYVPNTLTPDCDGADCEILDIASNCQFKKFHFILFNRWGEVIFETDDIKRKFDSQGYPQGSYSWKLNGETCKGKKTELIGYVTILH